ncbi:hypothetical protein IEQ34_005536 [Dendrobium chrysotoxum]|uniref:Protein kinase domain-containing protein n=1 Tax=Dendrobium chrysotoxum TaxID=161865 RepID=A0AAV7HBQ1_DENCH|nr:hypothetical protein IEQ34_005536 [Dendrobium chrysotoxum]
MLRWCLLLFLLPVSVLSSNTTCPYDIPYAAQMLPSVCYANSTSFPSATSCCWYVFAAYIYAAIRYSNLTGAAFLPPSTASACSSSFSSYLLHQGLAYPSLLSNSSCNLDGDPVRLAAGNRPCQFPYVSLIRSSTDLSPADKLCSSSPLNPDSHPSLCSQCQNAVINSTFSLLNVTNSKEIVPCGMAATIAIWSPHNPSLPRFRSFALCMLQILQNIGNLGTGDIVPSPPPPPPSMTSSAVSGSRTTKIIAGCATAAATSFFAVVAFLVFLFRKRQRKIKTSDGEFATSTEIISPVLPREGLYIFTKAELKQATNGYDDRLLLGAGGAGKVYLGKLPSGQEVAIKRIKREKKLGEFYREVEVLAKLRHRYLTTLVGYYLGERYEHALVYEYMAGGNLAGALSDGIGLTWRRRLRIAAEVAEGLVYLHNFPEGAVVHRDVKPTNVLLTEGGAVAKLSDFGVSRILPQEGSHVSTEVKGTMGYMDPESFSVGHVSEAADVYSFGVVLLELVTGMKAVVPTPSGGAESIVHAARNAVTDSDVESIVDQRLGSSWDRPTVTAVFELGRRCVKQYKQDRPAMADVLGELRGLITDLDVRSVGGSFETSPSAPSTTTTSGEPAWMSEESQSDMVKATL